MYIGIVIDGRLLESSGLSGLHAKECRGRGATHRIVQLRKEPEPRQQIGLRTHVSVRQRFLMSRLIEQYLDLFSGFEATYFLNQQRLSASGLPVTKKKSPHQP